MSERVVPLQSVEVDRPLRNQDTLTELLRILAQNGHRPTGGQQAALKDTPRRWWKAIGEMTEGYKVDVAKLLSVQFADVPADEMIVVTGIEFASLCEHHLMPFVGTATVGYLPHGHRVVGLSKLARLVEAHARRLQVQERMTTDIDHAIQEHLRPLGSGCIVRATHSCMACRGVRKQGAAMITSSISGNFRDPAVRAEFFALSRCQRGSEA